MTELTKNNFDKYAFNKVIWKLNEYTPSISESKTINNDISCIKLSSGIMLATEVLSNIVNNNYNYESGVSSIIEDLKRDFPNVNKLKPKGWSKLSKGYNDYDGMDELDSVSLKDSFKGMNSLTASSYPFEIRVSLPHVMYDDKCQGRKPLEVLVGAVLGHAYIMAEQNNTSKMLTEWVGLCSELEKSDNIQYQFKEPLNKVIIKMIEKNNFDNNQHYLKTLGIDIPKKKLKI